MTLRLRSVLKVATAKIVEPTIFELSSPGRTGVTCPQSDVPETALPPEELLRQDLPLPELAEVDVVRHYMHSQQIQLQRGQRLLSARFVHDEVQPEDQRGYLPSARFPLHTSAPAD